MIMIIFVQDREISRFQKQIR